MTYHRIAQLVAPLALTLVLGAAATAASAHTSSASATIATATSADFRANHDLIVIGNVAGGATLLAVEAKADESFGDHTVDGYLKLCAQREEARLKKAEERRLAGSRPGRPSNAARRIAELCAALFGPPEDGEAVAEVAKPLRYQLVAALAGALIEAQARKCTQAVLVVHEFLSSPDPERPLCGTNERKVARNASAWRAFSLARQPRQAGR